VIFSAANPAGLPAVDLLAHRIGAVMQSSAAMLALALVVARVLIVPAQRKHVRGEPTAAA
jgi:hypothetical protein